MGTEPPITRLRMDGQLGATSVSADVSQHFSHSPINCLALNGSKRTKTLPSQPPPKDQNAQTNPHLPNQPHPAKPPRLVGGGDAALSALSVGPRQPAGRLYRLDLAGAILIYLGNLFQGRLGASSALVYIDAL